MPRDSVAGCAVGDDEKPCGIPCDSLECGGVEFMGHLPEVVTGRTDPGDTCVGVQFRAIGRINESDSDTNVITAGDISGVLPVAGALESSLRTKSTSCAGIPCVRSVRNLFTILGRDDPRTRAPPR